LHKHKQHSFHKHTQLRKGIEDKNKLLRQLAIPSAASAAAAALFAGPGAVAAPVAAAVGLAAVTQRWDGFTVALQQVRISVWSFSFWRLG